jgi:hypothetical protein
VTVQKAVSDLKILLEHKQKVLRMIREYADKMTSDAGKNIGNILIQVVEDDLSNLEQILKELEPESKKTIKTKSEPTIKDMIVEEVRIQVTRELKKLKIKHDSKRKKKSL